MRCWPGLAQVFSTWAWLTVETGSFCIWGTFLRITECVTASLVSARWVSVAIPMIAKNVSMSPALDKCPAGTQLPLDEEHWTRVISRELERGRQTLETLEKEAMELTDELDIGWRRSKKGKYIPSEDFWLCNSIGSDAMHSDRKHWNRIRREWQIMSSVSELWHWSGPDAAYTLWYSDRISEYLSGERAKYLSHKKRWQLKVSMQKKVSLKKHLYSIASLLETRHLYNKIIKALQYCKIMSYKTTAVFSAKQVSECTGTTRVYLHWRES